MLFWETSLDDSVPRYVLQPILTRWFGQGAGQGARHCAKSWAEYLAEMLLESQASIPKEIHFSSVARWYARQEWHSSVNPTLQLGRLPQQVSRDSCLRPRLMVPPT